MDSRLLDLLKRIAAYNYKVEDDDPWYAFPKDLRDELNQVIEEAEQSVDQDHCGEQAP